MIIVKYKVIGDDHDGYCSGCSGYSEDDICRNKTIYSYKLFKDNERFGEYSEIDINVFYEYHNGCTSDGSGYCTGYRQEWIPLSVELINDKNKKKLIKKIKLLLKTFIYTDKEIKRLNNIIEELS